MAGKIADSLQLRESLKMNNNDEDSKKVSDKMHVKEWLHENARRPVKVIRIYRLIASSDPDFPVDRFKVIRIYRLITSR
jgi:hypothetical protein